MKTTNVSTKSINKEAEMKRVELIYNGFHGKQSFFVLADYQKSTDDWTPNLMTLKPSAVRRINRAVGCKDDCRCAEGLIDISGDPTRINGLCIPVRPCGDGVYEYRGNYPQL